jgi:uncharacterized repeat protein (TIGR03803 family)
VVQGSDGNFYGTTSAGGTNGGYGTIFKVTPNGAATVLYEFTNGVDGGNPRAGLVQGSDGSFYGTTYNGGTDGAGAVFKVTTNGTNGTFTSLYSFTGGTDGANPEAALVQGSDGSFYGTTYNGGSSNLGVVFNITTNGALTSLHSFAGGTDGANPKAALVQGSDGYFGGTTYSGGTSNLGTVFKITTNGTLFSLSFTNAIEGAYPQGALVKVGDDNYNYYGTTYRGGGTNAGLKAVGFGTVFKVNTTNGVLTTLYSFTDGVDGAYPQAGLALGGDGNLYGTTSSGGLTYSQGGYGTVFKITTNGALTSLYSFTGNADGAYPQAALAVGADGNFYGTASSGGVGYTAGGNGAVFRIAPNGTFAAVYAFPGLNDGQGASAVVHGTDGNFYGTTQYGGVNGGNGNVLKMTANGGLTSLYSFAGSYDGSNPQAALVQGGNGSFYGTTANMGSNNAGTVFSIAPGGDLTTMYAFTNGVDGGNPGTALVEGGDGSFYGTTTDGGTNNEGNVFEITPSGQFSNLYSFGSVSFTSVTGPYTNYHYVYITGIGYVYTNTPYYATNTFPLDGVTPNGLVLGSDGNFYGTAQSGGSNNVGTVFKLSSDGRLKNLYDFTGGTDGSNPMAALVQGVDGNFYGTTTQGGTFGNGTVFELTPNGFLTTLYEFTNGIDGYSPSGLLAGANGVFYGTTAYGGTNNNGDVFQVAANGAFTVLYSFFGSVNDGGAPQTSLAQGSDGSLYGTTSYGAVGGYGGVFRLSGAGLPLPLPVIAAQPANEPNILAGLSASFSVTAFGAEPLSYQWQINGANLPTGAEFSGTTLPILTVDPAFLSDAGSYSVIVSNSYGAVTSGVAVLSLYAPTNSAQAYADGTNYLAEADLIAANVSFSNAVSQNTNTSAGANDANNFFLAATDLLSLPEEPAGSNFLTHLGLSTTGRDLFQWKARLAHPIPLGVNADEITAQLRTNVLYAISNAQAALAGITDPNFTLDLTTNETHAGAVIVDYGDVQLLRSLCDTAELFIYTTYARNLDAQLTSVSNIVATDKSFQVLLADYPDLLTTTSTNDLSAAKGAFTSGANEYLAASQFIRSRPPGETRLFNLGTNDLKKELHFRETLTNLLASLAGGPAVTLTVNSNYEVSASNFFSGHFNLRAYLPQFESNEFVWNSFPDTTFGGIIDGLTGSEVSGAFRKHFNTVLNVPGVSVTVLYNFPDFLDQNGVVQAPDGDLYGTTQYGPITYTSSIAYYTNGSQPYNTNTFPGTNGFVITNITSNFAAYTNVEQNQGYGTVFKITPSGQYSALYTFGSELLTNIGGPYTGYKYVYDPALGYYVYTNYTYYQTNTYQLDGSTPNALVVGTDGNFYGTTQSGGIAYQTNYNGTNIAGITTNSYGTIFKITPSGHLTTLYNFGTAADQYASEPLAPLAQGMDGRFYGTTGRGGSNGWGTVFAIATNGAFTGIYSFTNQADGNDPVAPLVQGVDGSFYGTTLYGGTNGDGTIFKIAPSGLFSNLYTFGSVMETVISGPFTNYYTNVYYNTNIIPLDGASPNGLALGADGNLYGTAQSGGSNYDGTAFRISPSGVFTNLLTFNQNSVDGYSPLGSLVPSANGAFYGVASAGGENNSGALFLLNTNPTPTNITWFGKASGGYGNNFYSYAYNSYNGVPMPSPLVLGADGNYYGTTTDDGSYGSGTVYVLSVSTPPSIASQPASRTNVAGATVSFSVSVAGTAPISFYWFHNTSQLFNAGDVSGARSNVLTLTDISAGEAGSYSVIVSNALGTATSAVASLVIMLPPSITNEPLNQLAASGEGATFTVGAAGTLPLNYQWFFNGTNAISGDTNAVSVTNAGSYLVVVTNLYGAVTSSVAELTVEEANVAHPSITVSITSPAVGGRTPNLVTGKAMDTKVPVWNVFYTLTNINHTTNVTSGQAVLSNVTSGVNWSVTNILPGTNIIAVQAVDLASNHSSVVTRKFFSVTGAPLNLLTQGTGIGSFTVKSLITTEKNLTTNSLLNIGEEYEITAAPGAHSVFGGWTVTTTNSSLSTNVATVKFNMETSLNLTASFETNIYLAAAGTYNGLFAQVDSNGVVQVHEATAGLLGGLVVGTNGAYSGKLAINGASKSVSGSFSTYNDGTNTYGSATNKVALAGGAVLLDMTMDASTNPPYIYGTVSGSNSGAAFTSILLADRAANTLPAAQHTMLIPPGTNDPPVNSPGGYGYALITNTAGSAKALNVATISGALADGTTFSQTVPVSEDGYVPFYDSLYANKGLLLGWINLELTNTTDVGLTWIHPKTTSGLYKTGFTNVLPAAQIGLSPWTNSPAALARLTNSLTNLVVSDTTINSSSLFDVGVEYSKTFTLKESATGYLSGSVNPKTGLLKVTFGSKAGKTTNGFGAILQNTTNGGGYFLFPTGGEAGAGAIQLPRP